ncbi:hypothetical protein OOK29_35620 [Streptomyces phaeochromogenes]|uniref:hypothetical protein n=1 Tax=Streptomyces phaeochromogenes TaxID=1923 RepID=UPI00225092DD|nr:hypothetical protein [Streptomyces phaeochromogenes]MCX5603480.1 hypothetical protein [Streptomyces phaeochromogenes]
MSNQPYEGYDPYQQPPAGWPGHQQQYEADAEPDQQQYTQQWEGQTWETQVQPPITPTAPPPAPAADTAYFPQQAPHGPGAQQGAQQYAAQYGAQGAHGAQGGQYGVVGQPMPAETGWNQAGEPGQGGQPQGYPGSQGPEGYQGHQGYGGQTHVPAPAASASGSGPAPEYGPPTVTGNSGLTAAQRARAEGRSPVIEPGLQPAALTAVLGLLMAGAAAVGEYALVVPLVILQAVTAAGWFRLNGMWPARQGIALAFAGALTSDVALLAAGRENAPAAILGSLGVWVLLTLVLQLRSHASPDERMYGLMATVVSAALAIVATGHLAAEPDAVTVGAVAVGVAVLARAVPLPTVVSVVVGLVGGAAAGAVMGGLTDFGASSGAMLGAGAAVCALIGHRVASYDYPSRFVHFTAGVALPLAAAAPAIYVLGRALA